MDIAAITQFATAVMQFVFVMVIGAGYYFLFKVGRDTSMRCAPSAPRWGIPRSWSTTTTTASPR
jgi:hypothetical protein